MLDRFLDFGATFDWISPLAAMIQDVTNGPHHDFYVDRYAGWSGGEIKRLLKRHGVHVWGLMFLDDLIVFSVRQAQADWAQYLLLREKIPIVHGYIANSDSRAFHPKSRGTSPQPNRQPQTGALDAVFHWLDELGDRFGS